MAVLESCPKHNMVAYLEKTSGNAEFHEVIDFLALSSIHNALTLMNVPVPLDHFPVNALTSKVFSFMVKKGKHFSGKIIPLFSSMLIQPTEDEGAQSERPSEPQPTPFPTHLTEVHVEPQSDPSPRPSPTTHIPDSILEDSGGNHRGQSSSDRSLSRNEGGMTLQSVYDLCISLCTQVTDQAKEIKHLKAQIMKLKKKAKPVITPHRAWMKSASLKHRLARKKSLKKQWMQKDSVSKQGRKSAKAKPTVHKDQPFDELADDKLDYMESQDAQDVGRIRNVVSEEKETADNRVSTEDAVSTKDVVSTDKEKVSTDRSKVSVDRSRVSTDKEELSTDRPDKGTNAQTAGRNGTQTPPTTTTPSIFGDDETIAQVLLNMSQAKAVSREKEKGVELKDSDSESEGISEAEKKFKQLAKDEEMARKVQEEWEGKEERKRLAEEKATNDALIRNYDDIKARIEADRLLAERLQEEERESEAIRNRPPTKNQLRNQMLTYLKHVGNFKHSDLKTKKFEEIQALYEKIKSLKKRVVKETSKTEDTAKVPAKSRLTEQENDQVIPKDDHKIGNLSLGRLYEAVEFIILELMLDLGLEVERESTAALDLIRFIKQQIDEN
ncbi:hypothetical protein Tco_0745451 [Tanacetum coccineum]